MDYQEIKQKKVDKYTQEEYLEEYAREQFLTDDGDADIFFKIKSVDDIFDEHSYGNQLQLKKSLFAFVEEKSSMFDSTIPIHLHIVGHKVNDEDQEKIRKLYEEHYAIELHKVQRDYIYYRNRIFHLIILGLFFLLTYALLYLYTNYSFCLEVFGFLFSFALWQAGESYLYDVLDVNRAKEEAIQNLLTQVDFE